MEAEPITAESIREQMLRRAKVDRWKQAMLQEMDNVYTIFQEPRADAVMLAAERLRHLAGTSIGAIQAIGICTQIEGEFPGRVQEFVEEAHKHPNGMIHGLGQYIRYQRGQT
jgi:hypothetical protein